jgi:uncharacterized protein (DUF2267 family)
MNLAQQHQEAMSISFLAKQEREKGEEDKAIELYLRAADLESQVADYYFDKPDLEPTRSILIRSAAFLNLKAGIIERAEKFIFWGLVNILDAKVKEQLYEALELCVAYRGLGRNEISGNVDYIYKLRQKSVFYTIEPKNREYSGAVTLEMISDFSTNFTKSLKAYSKNRFKNFFRDRFKSEDAEEAAADYFQDKINPLITNAGFGSFKFAVAADFLSRVGENEELTKLKSNILIRYHDDVFRKELTEENIKLFKSEFPDYDIEQIFRPLFNIRSNKADYKVAYYDRESLELHYVSKTKNSQKSELLPVKVLNSEDIGKLESTIAHTRTTAKGTYSRSVILKQELKSYSFDHKTNLIEPKGSHPIILNQEIIISVGFNSQVGFTFSFDDLPVEVSAIVFADGLSEFYNHFISLIRELRSKENRTEVEEQYWSVIKKLVENPDLI